MIGLPPLAGALYCDIYKTPPSYYYQFIESVFASPSVARELDYSMHTFSPIISPEAAP